MGTRALPASSGTSRWQKMAHSVSAAKGAVWRLLRLSRPVVRRLAGAIALGETSVLKKVLEQKKELTVEDVVGAAKAGDDLARRIYRSAGTYLGTGIANLVNIINPQRVIVSGEGLRAGEFLTEPMIKAFRDNCYPSIVHTTELIVEPLGDDAWARGAASLVAGEIFKAPAFVYRHRERRVFISR